MRLSVTGIKASQLPARETFIEQIAIDGLRSGGALTCGNDDLTIGRSDASGGVESFHRGLQAGVDHDFTIDVDLRANHSCQPVEINVTTRREQGVGRKNSSVGKAK